MRNQGIQEPPSHSCDLQEVLSIQSWIGIDTPLNGRPNNKLSILNCDCRILSYSIIFIALLIAFLFFDFLLPNLANILCCFWTLDLPVKQMNIICIRPFEKYYTSVDISAPAIFLMFGGFFYGLDPVQDGQIG